MARFGPIPLLAADGVADPETMARQHFLDSVEQLVMFPATGRAGRKPNTRELVVPNTPYFVLYRIKDEMLEILRVIHGARKWP